LECHDSPLSQDEEYLQRSIKDIDFRLNTLTMIHNREGSTGGGAATLITPLL